MIAASHGQVERPRSRFKKKPKNLRASCEQLNTRRLPSLSGPAAASQPASFILNLAMESTTHAGSAAEPVDQKSQVHLLALKSHTPVHQSVSSQDAPSASLGAHFRSENAHARSVAHCSSETQSAPSGKRSTHMLLWQTSQAGHCEDKMHSSPSFVGGPTHCMVSPQKTPSPKQRGPKGSHASPSAGLLTHVLVSFEQYSSSAAQPTSRSQACPVVAGALHVLLAHTSPSWQACQKSHA